MRLRPALQRALEFVSTHPGTRRKAMFTHRYYFTEPKLKRPPFRLETIEELVQRGLVEAVPVKGQRFEIVQISDLGKACLLPPDAVHPVDRRGRRKRLAKDWC